MRRRPNKVPDHLVENLADPFDVFPLIQALHGLEDLIEQETRRLYSEYEDLAPKYRHVGLEQGLEANSILIGAGFVAAQAMLTRTFSAVKNIEQLECVREAGGAGLPRLKTELFSIGALD